MFPHTITGVTIIFFRESGGKREQITIDVAPETLETEDRERLERHLTTGGRVYLGPGRFLSLPSFQRGSDLLPQVLAGLRVHERRQDMVLAGLCTFGVCPLLALLFHPSPGSDHDFTAVYVIVGVGLIGAISGLCALLFYHPKWPWYVVSRNQLA